MTAAVLQIGDFIDFIDMVPQARRAPRAWALTRVHPNREMTVTARLLERGVTAYVATETWSRPTSFNRRRIARLPIFAGLIFVADFDAHLGRLRTLADGVIGFVAFGGQVAFASQQTMAEVHMLEARLSQPLGQRKFKVGQIVRVVQGPFNWWEGPIDRLDSHGRINVLLDVLGRQVAVPFDETQIEPV